MAFVLPENSQISPFNILLGTISSQLSRESIRKIKVQLRGHVNKELLSKLKGGFDVIHILQERGLVSEKKLSFLRKLLQNCELFALIELLDEYKQAVHVMNGKSKEGDNGILTTRRINTLQRLMGRQLEELANCSARGTDLRKLLEEKQTLLDSQKEIIIVGQEAIDSISEQRELAEQEKSVVEERAQESEAMFEAQEKEFNELQGLLGAKDKKPKKNEKADKRKTIFDKHTNEKTSKSLETFSKQRDEKQETLKKMINSVDDIRAQLLAKRQTVRHCNEAVFLKTKELVSVDQCILETMEGVRKLKQDIRRNEFDLFDLQQQIEETQDELERTRRNGIANKAFKIPLWRLETPRKHKSKALNYSEVLEENSYSLGALGMRSVPLQFDFPCCVASHNGLIYAADRNNCRVLVFDAVGELSREPIGFGSTGPLAIAVNKRGNMVVTDSQIIKVFSSDGALSHNFLPVYSKRDTRPEISALTLDRDGNILAADRPNHRIQKFRIDGHFLGFIGGSMYLQYPSGVAITKDNDVVISECESHQLKIFHEHGKSFTVIGRSGVGKDQLMNPRGLAVDNTGNILVADSSNHRIQVIDSQGNFVGSFGRLGSGPGCLDTPYAVAVNRRGHVIVADSGNHRITCFT